MASLSSLLKHWYINPAFSALVKANAIDISRSRGGTSTYTILADFNKALSKVSKDLWLQWYYQLKLYNNHCILVSTYFINKLQFVFASSLYATLPDNENKRKNTSWKYIATDAVSGACANAWNWPICNYTVHTQVKTQYKEKLIPYTNLRWCYNIIRNSQAI